MGMDSRPPPPEKPLRNSEELGEPAVHQPVDFAIQVECVGYYTVQLKGGIYCPKHHIGGDKN